MKSACLKWASWGYGALKPPRYSSRQRSQEISGSAVFAGMEGTRARAVEIAGAGGAIAAFGTPRRAVIGWEQCSPRLVLARVLAAAYRLARMMFISMLQAAYVLPEPAADLSRCVAALASSLSGVPVPSDMVIFGEIGLSGEVRNVGQMDTRLKKRRNSVSSMR